MSNVFYGNTDETTGILLDVLTPKFEKKVIRDRAENYIYTEVTLIVNGLFNPHYTSYTQSQGSNPVSTPNTFPANTETAIRHWLSQSRKLLLYYDNQGTILRTPQTPGVDSKNGLVSLFPPSIMSSNDINGERTWIIECGWKTWINESYLYTSGAKRPLVLSNLWDKIEELDQDYRSVITTKGRAVFDTAALRDASSVSGVNGRTPVPDDFRNWLTHTIPAGFARTARFKAAEDGTELAYELVDRQKDYIIPKATGITRIEGTHTVQLAQRSNIDFQLKSAQFAQRWASSWLDPANLIAAGQALATGPIGLIVAGSIAASQFEIESTQLKLYGLPVLTHTLDLRIWGQHYTNRRTLHRAANVIIANRLRHMRNDQGRVFPNFAVDFTGIEDIQGCFVSYHASFAGPIPNNEIFEGPVSWPDLQSYFPIDDDIPGLWTYIPPSVAGQNTTNTMGPPNDRSRGGFLGYLAAQVLNTANTSATVPELSHVNAQVGTPGI